MEIDSRLLRALILGAGLLALLAIGYFCAYPKVAMPEAVAVAAPEPAAHLQAPAVQPAVTEAPRPAEKPAARVVAAINEVIKGRTIEFEPGSAELSPAGRALVEALVAPIQADTAARLAIAGYTDNEGDPNFNKALSLARATAVRDVLIARGVDAGRLAVQGYGAERPIADNASYEGRMRNRRVEFSAAD